MGVAFAKGLALGLGKPFLGVNHLHAHLLAVGLEHELHFPALGLLVSGGHTHIYRLESPWDCRLLGRTLDDAAGEAFDKVGKFLGLAYPGGKLMDALARAGHATPTMFPRPYLDNDNLDFSFSGLKTFALNTWQQCRDSGDDLDQARRDIALAFQQAVVETLTIKCKRALKQSGLNSLVIAGGVSANKALREHLERMLGEMKGKVFYARPRFCTDNGAMIAYAGCQRLLAGQHEDLAIKVQARWPMELLPAI